MRLKLKKRSTIIVNLCLYILLSSAYLHIVLSLGRGESAVDLEDFIVMLSSNPFLLSLMIISLFAVYNAYNFSKIIFPLFSLLVFYESMIIFFTNFDKLILILNLSYLVMSYYYYLFWSIELSESVYRPCFSKHMIGIKSPYNIKTVIESDFSEDLDGYLTNWDGASCFINTNAKIEDLIGPVKIIIKFEGRTYSHWGDIISTFGYGFGVRFIGVPAEESSFNWLDFFTIVSHRGLSPYVLKN